MRGWRTPISDAVIGFVLVEALFVGPFTSEHADIWEWLRVSLAVGAGMLVGFEFGKKWKRH